ncbi:MAG: KAP family NTPase [Raineya sp.]|jgi:hypothetical protein|nr:KAP family NTPase [Raineya sp.]
MADSTQNKLNIFKDNIKMKWEVFSFKSLITKLWDDTKKIAFDLKFIFLISLIILPFKEPLEDLLELIITPILSKIQSEKFIDICIFIGIFLYGIFSLKRRIRLSDFITFFLIIIVYLYYRFIEKRWLFVDFEVYPQFKYLDIIILLPFPYIISYTRRTIIKTYSCFIALFKTQLTPDIYSGFHLDRSLEETEDDTLGREKFADEIAKKISNTQLSKSSLAIGILGEWGSGKTSFLNLIERHLDKESIIIKFNPWINQDSKSIIKDFFNALSEELSKYHFNVSSALKDYSDILSGVGDNNLNKILSPLLKFISQRESVASEFEKINFIIKNINKRIIIFIDDVDRLHEDEIIQVMKLIRNSANFANTTFIVAYDRNYLLSAIKKINTYASENYLEKIFQFEIPLPNFEKERILGEVHEVLSPHLLANHKKFIDPKSDEHLHSVFELDILSNLRDVKRFTNSFLIMYHLLKEETIFKDLFYIEFLKCKYPDIYKFLFKNKSKFLKINFNDDLNRNYYDWIYEDNNLDKDLEIKVFIEKNVPILNINTNDIEKIISLLYLIIPASDGFHHEPDLLSIINPSSFERYSFYRLLDSNLSEAEFSNARQKENIDTFCKKIDQWLKKVSYPELSERFRIIEDFDSKEDFEKIISGIFYLGRKSGYSIEDLYEKIRRYHKHLSYFTKDSYKNFILNILEKAEPPYTFDMALINHMLHNFRFDNIPLAHQNEYLFTEDEYQDIRYNYFKKYLDSIDSFKDNHIWSLYNLGDDIYKVYQNPRTQEISTQNFRIRKLLLDFIEKFLDKFLAYIIIKGDDPQTFTIKRSFIETKTFPDFAYFKKYINNINTSNSKNINQFKKFYTNYEANGYRETPFTFSASFFEEM